MFVVATSRFGIDRALHAVRNPADWLQIEVEGADNLHDMRRFIEDITAAEGGDARLLAMLRDGGVQAGWFRENVARICAGVWIYLRYVLDEIRDGTRSPRSIGDLPGDLAGFYAEQVDRWRGAADDETAQRRWEQVRLPLLGVLGAARAPLTVARLADFAGVASAEAARAFIEETARAFLSRRDDDHSGAPRYALRHQSLRDLLTGNVPARPDLQTLARMFTAQVRAAHRQITGVLTPPGEPGGRDWDAAGAVCPPAPGRARRRVRSPGYPGQRPRVSCWLPIPVPSWPSGHTCAPRTASARWLHLSSACTTGTPQPPRPVWAAWPPMLPGCMPPRSVRHAKTLGATGRSAGRHGLARDTAGCPDNRLQ